MRILITGATGFLGQHLARTLLERGHELWLLGRNFATPEMEKLIRAGAIALPVDLRTHAAVSAACEHVELVYHIGALSAPWGRRADFYATNVGGTEAVIAGCRAHAVRRLVYVSSPSVVFNGRDQHEATEQQPYPRYFASPYSWSKKLAEDRVNAVQDFERVILRPKAIFGPGDQALLPRLINVARQGRLPQIGDGRNLVDLTYVENVVQALLLAGTAPKAVGKTYTITNDEHILLWEMIFIVLRRLGLSTNLRRLPLPFVLAMASLMELRGHLDGKEPPLTRYSAEILGRTQTYDISAAQRDLGYVPIISVAEGMARTLAALEIGV